MKKRVLSLFLCLVMCLSMLPTSALAGALDLAPGEPVQKDVTVGAAAPTAPAEPVQNAEPVQDAKPEADDDGNEVTHPTAEDVASYVDDNGILQYVTDLDEAFNDLMGAESVVTITLLKDATLNDSYTCSPLIINLNGFTITGNLEANESLTLNNGVIKGTLKMDCYGGSLVANGVAINGELNVIDGNASVSGAAVGVTGELVIATDSDSEVTISGTEKAVMLNKAASNGSVIINLYSNGVEATYENGTYTVNGEVAKELTTETPSGGETTPANLSISPENATIHPLGGSATFTVTYDGTDGLEAYVQKSAVKDYPSITLSEPDTNGQRTLTVETAADTDPGNYTLFVHEKNNTSVSTSATVTVSDHNIVDGKCTICNTEFAARCDSVYFATFNDALKYVDSHPNCTIQLLKKIQANDPRELDLNTAFTLDLNGFTVCYALRVFSNLTIVDSSTNHTGSVTWIDLYDGGSLTVTSGNVETLDVYGGSATLSGDQSKDVDITAYGGSVVINHGTYSGNVQLATTDDVDEETGEAIYTGGTITVTGGTFNGEVTLLSIGDLTISSATFNGTVVAGSGEDGYYADTKTLAGVLADNCAFYDTATGEIRSADTTTLSKVEVKSHDHSFDSSTGKCACGFSAAASVTVTTSTTMDTTYFDTFDDALTMAQTNGGSTLTLYTAVPSGDMLNITGTFTLDQNGQDIYRPLLLKPSANLTFTGNENGFVTGDITISSCATLTITGGRISSGSAAYINIESPGATLNISGGTFDSRSFKLDNGGHLTISSGTFTGNTVFYSHDTRDVIALSGGTFTSITVNASSIGNLLSSVNDLLADNYAFYGVDTDTFADNGAKTLTNVEVKQHTHSFNADGICECGARKLAVVTMANGAATFFDSFDAALAAAKDNAGSTLKLLQDYAQYQTINLSGCSFTLDCTDHTFQPNLVIAADAGVKLSGGTFKGNITATGRTLADIMAPGKTLVASSTYVDMSKDSISGSVTVYDVPILEARILPQTPSNPTHYSKSDQIKLEAYVKLQEGYTSGVVIQWYKVVGDSYTPVGESSMYYTPGKLDVGTHYFAFDVAYNGYVVRSAVISIQITTDPATYKFKPAAVKNLTYNGEAQELVSGGETGDGTIKYRLGEDGEWSTDIPTGVNAGTYTVYYKIEPDANHSGTNVSSLKVTIAKQPVTIQKIIVENADNIVYTGRELEPAFTVFLSDIEILGKTQYDVTYSNNINASERALITIKPKADGNYTFDAYTAEFTIQKAEIAGHKTEHLVGTWPYTDTDMHSLRLNAAFLLAELYDTTTNYQGVAPTGVALVNGSVKGFAMSSLYRFDYAFQLNVSKDKITRKPNEISEFTVTYSFANYESFDVRFTVKSLDLPTPEISASDITVTYNGKPVPASAAKPTATVDGTWSWKNDAQPTNVKDSNTYVLVFTPKDTAKYRSAEKEVKVTIKPAEITGFKIEVNTTLTYQRDGVRLFDRDLTITGQPDGTTVHYLANNSLMNPHYVDKVYGLGVFMGVGSRTVYYKVSGDNYVTLTGSFTFTIEQAMPRIYPQAYANTRFFTGKPMENPTAVDAGSSDAGNLTVALGSAANITGYNWFTATKQGSDYVKGTALDSAPIDAGDYWLDVVFKESEEGETKAATIGFGLTVKPQTDEQKVNPDAYTVYANRAHTYEVDLSSYLSDLRLGTDVTYQLTNGGGFPPFFLADGQSVTLSGTTLTIPMASKTNNPLPSKIYTLVIWVKSSNYSQITLSLPIQIDAKPTKNLDVTMLDWTYGTIGTATYYISGTKQTPEGEAKLSYFDADGDLLKKTYPTEVGTYSVQVLVENDTTIYVGTTSFEILPRNIKAVFITLARDTLTYNGAEQEVKITEVKDPSFILTLSERQSYEIVSGSKGKDAGEYILKIKGIGNYTGEKTVTWTIAPKKLDNPTIVVAAGSTYNGKQQTPAVTVYDGEAIEANLIPDTEYTVEYGKNVDAGTDKGTLSLADVEGGNYTISGSATFNIAKAALPDNFVYAYTLPALIYHNRETHTSVVNGSTYASAFHFPENALPSVVLGEVTGNIDVDASYFNLSYTLKDGAAAGDTYTFELTYSFPDYVDATVTFKLPVIDRAAPTVTPDEITMVYSGSAVPAEKITGTAKVGNETISGAWSWADGVTAPTNVSESGEYDVTFTPSDEVNYKPASAKVKVTITPVSIEDAVITLDGTQLVYNRAEQEKGITAVKAGAFTLAAGDYTVTGSKATDAGTHTLTLTGKGNFKDNASTTWTIAPKSVTNPTIEIAPGSTYDGSAQKPAVTVKDGDDVIPASEYTVSFGGNVNAGENTASVTITDNENGNYSVSGSAAFSIAKAAHTITASDLTAVYGQTDCVIQPTGTFGDVNYAVKSGADVAAVDENGALRLLKSGAAVITVSDTGDENHLAAALDVSVTVSKANVTITAMDKSTFTSDNVPDLSNPKDGEDYTVSGLIGEDTLDVTVVLSYDEAPNMNKTGTYAIIPSVSGEDARYSFTFENGTLEIKQRPVSPKPTYPVTVISDENGETKSSVSIALKDQTVTITTTPKNGYTLSAVFVTDANGRQLPLTDLGNGCFSFTMPASKVTVRATYRKLQSTSFKDVLSGAYYYDAVQWAVDSSITTGVGNDLFDPNGICTRAQIITFLWRAAGCPEPESPVNPFNDIKSGDYYYKAVLWAVETGITKGISAGQFRPNDSCTRAQAVTFLFRAFGTKTNAVSAFRDVSQNAYYAPAVNWAVKDGVTNGTAPALFSPDTTCTRAQIVTFLYRAFKTR